MTHVGAEGQLWSAVSKPCPPPALSLPYPALCNPIRAPVRPLSAGPLTREQHDLFLRNPRFNGLKFPDMRNPETLDRKYAGKMPHDALAFMK